MTYSALLKTTAERKKKVIADLNRALNGPGGFLVRAEIERDPIGIAYVWLAKEFCETLAENIGELVEQAGGVDTYEAREIGDIYMAYEDNDPRLYELLPVEAKLFEED